MRYYQSIFLYLAFSLSVCAQQEQLNSKLNEVVITANRSETSTDEIGSSFTVITSEQISKYQKANVLEFLRVAEGIDITQQGGTGKLSSAFVRGASPSHLLVMIDGVKLNNPSSPNNAFDLSTIMTDFVDRIEIVRGPQSTLYGSEALAGVINIITKEGKRSPTVSLNAETGSNNFVRGNIGTFGKIEEFKYSVNFSKLRTDGFSAVNSKYGNREKDNADLTNGLVNVGYNISENISLSAGYIFSKSKAGLDQSDKHGDDPNYNYDYEEHVVKSGIDAFFFDGRLKSIFSVSSSRRFSNAIDKEDALHPGMSSTNYAMGKRLNFNFQNILTFLPGQRITFGVETENESAETSYRSKSTWGPYESIFPMKNINNTALYLQDQIKFQSNAFLTAGLRYDKHEKFGDVTTFRIAPAYIISSTQTKLKGSFGTGFKAPSLFYLFDPLFGNIKLKPEENTGYDFGFEQFLFEDKVSFGAEYFNANYKNMIGFDENFKAININKAATSGVEIVANYFTPVFSAQINYTYLKAIDKSKGISKSEEKLIRRPANKASLDLSYSPSDKITLNSLFRFVGEREDVDYSVFPSARVTLPSYLLVDLAASYQLLDTIKLTFRLENLFDKEYEEVLFYGTQRRAFFFGINYNLGI
ncbi:MAG: TonB-dependent receptor [Ignavibacteriales bacterium]